MIDNTKAIRELAFIDEQIRLLQVQRERLLWRTAGVKRGDVVVLTGRNHVGEFGMAVAIDPMSGPDQRPNLIVRLQTREGWTMHWTNMKDQWRPLAKGEAAPGTEGGGS